jgi:L-lysine 4-chlorinase
MSDPKADDLVTQVTKNGISWLTPEVEFQLYNQFARDGFVRVSEIVPEPVLDAVRQEVFRLLDEQAERRDLLLATTDNTPRFMSVVRSEFIAENSSLLEGL